MLAVRNPRCMAVLLPSNQVVVGDSQGMVTCFDTNSKGGVQWTLDTTSVTSAPKAPVTALYAAQSDKFFAAAGQFVMGAKKGKAFYCFDVGGSISGPIVNLCVKKELLFLATRNSFYLYEKNNLTATLSLPATTINSMAVLEIQSNQYIVVLATADKCLRIVDPLAGTISHELHLDHIPTISTPADASSLLVGTSSGSILALSLLPRPSLTWSHSFSSSPIRFLHALTTPSHCLILSGLETGAIYLQTTSTFHDPPVSSRSFNINDVPIHGAICQRNETEHLVVLTHSGSLNILSTTSNNQNEENSESYVNEKDVATLRSRLERETDALVEATGDLLAPAPNFACESAMEGRGCGIQVTIKTAVPICMVAIKTGVKYSISFEGDAYDGEFVSQKVRVLKQPSNRIVHPEYVMPSGAIDCYVFSDTVPRFSTTVSQNIPSLYFYDHVATKVSTYISFSSARLLFRNGVHSLALSAEFYLPDFLYWLSLLFPSVPERIAESVTLNYHSPLTNTFVECTITYAISIHAIEKVCRKTRCCITTDSICALGICKEVITRESAKQARTVNVECHVAKESIEREVKSLEKELKHEVVLEKKRKMKEGIREVLLEGGVMKEYMDILEEDTGGEEKLVWLKKYLVMMKMQYHNISGHAVRVVLDDVDEIVRRNRFTATDMFNFVVNS